LLSSENIPKGSIRPAPNGVIGLIGWAKALDLRSLRLLVGGVSPKADSKFV
jgi:hypothetical protein